MNISVQAPEGLTRIRINRYDSNGAAVIENGSKMTIKAHFDHNHDTVLVNNSVWAKPKNPLATLYTYPLWR